MRRLGFGCVLFLLACSADVDRRQEPVIGGMAVDEMVFPASGALVVQGMFFCSGTLVTPTAVLTAAHCIDPRVLGPIVPGFTFVSDTTGGVSAADTHAGARTIQHPAFDGFTPDGQFHDIGLLILAAPVTDVTPVPMAMPSETSTLRVGAQVDIVGYGLTDPFGSEAGVKHHGVATLAAMDTWLYQIGPQNGVQNCNGDSGGPAFWEPTPGQPRVVGVVTGGPEPCTMGGFDIRVDAHYEWLAGELGMVPEPPMCDPPQVACGADCVDTQNDPFHCGGCDQTCFADEDCEQGQCWPPGMGPDAGAPDAGMADAGMAIVLDAGGDMEPGDDGGCSCRVGARRAPTPWAVGLLGLALFGLRRRGARRRRRRRPPSPRDR